MERDTDAARHEAKIVNQARRTLLSIIELGGYPNFTPLYQQAGYTVESVTSVRKALGLLKKINPDVIVAEFNFQSCAKAVLNAPCSCWWRASSP